MYTARFDFLPDLNTFLTPERRAGSFETSFSPGQSIKHLVEAAGVPHTEVGVITVNAQPVDFDYLVQDADKVIVHPATASSAPLDITPRFVLDNHLGRLAAYLRMLGFDGIYHNDFADEALAEISAAEDRILLTRDRHLLMRKVVRYGYCLRSLDPRRQTEEVMRRYNLFDAITPFQRCLRCNTPLIRVSKEAVFDRLEPLTQKYYGEFHICPACGQIYWKGSHYQRMREMIEQLHRDHSAADTPES